MHGRADRQSIARRWRGRAAAAAVIATLTTLAIAGCSDPSSAGGGSSSSTPPLVTGEQVVTACFQSYFYNGILPRASAESNCRSCVVDQLRKLGVSPSSGENVIDMLTGDRLSSSDIQSLQNNCNESDANEQ
ncbi:MAG TPA: hypothetical protein VHU61_04825 [Solirubrobacteraceae bacterium]|nr:hypothetical protein [Solirubrobacteraceae bacterium]